MADPRMLTEKQLKRNLSLMVKAFSGDTPFCQERSVAARLEVEGHIAALTERGVKAEAQREAFKKAKDRATERAGRVGVERDLMREGLRALQTWLKGAKEGSGENVCPAYYDFPLAVADKALDPKDTDDEH